MVREFPPALLNRLSFVLGRLYFRALELEGARLEPLGIDVKQQAVLALLAEDGPMTQQELGRRIGIDRTTIVGLVDGLEDGGLVERRRSPADRRAYLLTLTEDGRRVRQRGQRLVDTAEATLLAGLSEPDRRTLSRLLADTVAADLAAEAG